MNRFTSTVALLFAPASLALVVGCNGAQFSQPPPGDAGELCSAIAPIIKCDAGGPPSANSCTAEPTSSDSTVSRIPAGNYPATCTVQFYFDDTGGGCSPAPNPCQCNAVDAGPDASAQAQWSSCADAGITGF